MSSALIQESKRPKTYRHNLVEYKTAFIADGVLTLNGRASTGWRVPGERSISARYPISSETGLPVSGPCDVLLKTRRAPKDARLVPIEYVDIPYDDLNKRDDPKLYDRFTPTNTIPTILVNAPDLPPSFPNTMTRVNHFHALFVDGTPSGPAGSILIRTPSHSKTVSQRASLIALPVTVAADIVTLPIQGIMYLMIEEAFKDVH